MARSAIKLLDLGPRDGSLYVHGFHSSLTVKGSRVVAASEDVRQEIPMERLGRVFVFGHCTFSSGVIDALLSTNVPIHHLSAGGSLKGVTISPPLGQPGLRRAQWQLADDQPRALGLARSFVAHKIVNQRSLLLRYRRRWQSINVSREVSAMRNLRRSLPNRSSIAEVMGVEGAAARAYFSALRQIIDPVWGFNGRNQRPPHDPVNSLMSFGYSLLLGEVRATLQSTGLDESVGVLHEIDNNRPSLALDVMEEFRPLIVDSLVLGCVNNRRLTPEHFILATNAAEPEVRLSAEGRRRFFNEYERRLTTGTHHQPSGRYVSYREAILLHAKHLGDVIREPHLPYRQLCRV